MIRHVRAGAIHPCQPAEAKRRRGSPQKTTSLLGVWVAAIGLSLGCASATAESPRLVTASDKESAATAIFALQQGRFEEAERLAQTASASSKDNPYPRLVSAITQYKRTMRQLWLDGETLVVGGLETGAFNQKYLKTSLTGAEEDLAKVEADLAIVAKNKGFSMELCLACWDVDWNGNGRVDNRDRRLLEIEVDEQGEEIPEGDPRRRPTFRFDDGDVAWARAFVSFQRAAIDVLLAYDFTEVAAIVRRRGDDTGELVMRLTDRDRMSEARKRILEGLAFSEASRRAYLEETDDDREWVPNPRQKSHPMPLSADAALYATWEGVVGDLQRMIAGEEGLSAAELFALTGERAHFPPRGYIDLGRMLAEPKDIRIDLGSIERFDHDDDLEGILQTMLGDYYQPSMKPSPLPRRLLRMKGEIDQHEGELDRKLRYLFWIN